MAKMTVKAGADYALKLSRLAANSDAVAKKAIHAGAGILADGIKRNLKGVTSAGASGDLANSFGISPIKRDKDGNWNTKLGFDGYDRNGVPNQLKARVMESGSSRQKKRPFVRPAVNATKGQVQAEMARVIDEETGKIMK